MTTPETPNPLSTPIGLALVRIANRAQRDLETPLDKICNAAFKAEGLAIEASLDETPDSETPVVFKV